MKLKPITMASVLFSGVVFALQMPASAQDAKPSSLEDRVSYAYGTVVARDLKDRGVPINPEQFMKAFQTIIEGGNPVLSESEISKAFDDNRQYLDEQNATGEDKENLLAGNKFLAENATKEGVKTTDRGLQYKILEEGDGPKPKVTDEVLVHYHGTLIDGTVFDSSVDRGEPISFPLSRVIPGWTEGLRLMPKGSKYRLFIPYYLAYGEAGAAPKIKPYSALIFDVELLDIK